MAASTISTCLALGGWVTGAAQDRTRARASPEAMEAWATTDDDQFLSRANQPTAVTLRGIGCS
jgi:hypothetical protein